MNKAVFLDRDGVINELVYNNKTNDYEPPHHENDLELYSWTIASLKKLMSNNFHLFIVSNQPDYAKGKTSLENLYSVHNKLNQIFISNGIMIHEYYYCYHHPEGVVQEYSFDCECRKPNPHFVFQGINDYHIDPGKSWFIGDRDTDIFCGQKAGLKTILIENILSKKNRGKSSPQYKAENLEIAVDIIIERSIK